MRNVRDVARLDDGQTKVFKNLPFPQGTFGKRVFRRGALKKTARVREDLCAMNRRRALHKDRPWPVADDGNSIIIGPRVMDINKL